MSSFGKHLSLIRAFVHGYYEVLIMKLNVWLDIPSKYIEYSCVTVSVAVDIFSKRLTDIFCKVFHFGFWYFSSYCIINWCKNVLLQSFFFQNLPALWFVLFACYVLAGVKTEKQKVVHFVLSFWPICVMLRSYMLILL